MLGLPGDLITAQLSTSWELVNWLPTDQTIFVNRQPTDHTIFVNWQPTDHTIFVNWQPTDHTIFVNWQPTDQTIFVKRIPTDQTVKVVDMPVCLHDPCVRAQFTQRKVHFRVKIPNDLTIPSQKLPCGHL